MDFAEIFRRLIRYFELVKHAFTLVSFYRYRRVFFVALGLFLIIWIFGGRLFSSDNYQPAADPIDECLQSQLSRLKREVKRLDTIIQHIPKFPDEHSFLPYVGNGYIGAVIVEESTIHIKVKNGRVLSLPLPFRPVVRISTLDEDSRREALVSQYVNGVVQKISCIQRDNMESLVTVSKFFAHRTHPSIFEQDVTISNPSQKDITVQLEQLGWTNDPTLKSELRNTKTGEEELKYTIGRGVIQSSKGLVAVSVAFSQVPKTLEVKAKSVLSIRFVTAVNYAFIASKRDFDLMEQTLINRSEMDLKRVFGQNTYSFQNLHETAWGNLWTTGFYISPSKAVDVLNGDSINATIYYVLSQVRSPLYEVNVPQAEITAANAVLAYPEGCYGGHHTLQAKNLWSTFKSEREIVEVSNLWLLTLQRLGCHNLLKAGASGVIQGMVLSFGGLKFSNYHLEFNTEPKDLHRDYHFRRIAYGNGTHVNISVTVGSNNKAVLAAALDRSDKEYFACDAGCLDTPVQLGPEKKQFPVKLTDPITSILYITSDRSHIEELRLSIHVKEVLEAPAHENHVLSMHKHGSGYGTMSTVFWISISLVIVLFHLFLFHLVYTEYFGSQEKFRTRIQTPYPSLNESQPSSRDDSSNPACRSTPASCWVAKFPCGTF